MKNITFILGLLLMVASVGAWAQDSSNDSMGDLFGDGFDFDEIKADSVEYDPSGMVRLTGKVVIKSDQLDVECDELWKKVDSDKMIAIGKPVKIRNADIRAQCNKFTYDLKTKKSVLEEGTPNIIQRNNGKVTKITADIITLFQNKKGEMGFTFKRKENSRNQTKIEVIASETDPKATAKKDTKDKEAKKVDKDSLDLIPSFVE